MATEYPVPAFRRIYLRWEEPGLFQTFTDLAAAPLEPYSDVVDRLDRDVYSGTPLVIPAGGGFMLHFDHPFIFQAYLLSLVSGSAPQVSYTRDDVPNLSTGTWIDLGTATLQSVTEFRTPTSLVAAPDGVKAIRFVFPAGAQVGNFHLYGVRSSESIDFAVVQDDGVTEAPPSYFNFGTGGKNGWKDITFRIQNRANASRSWTIGLITLTNVTTGTPLQDQLFISTDGGNLFQSMRRAESRTIYSVPVGALSPEIIIRRYAPADHDNSKPHSVNLYFNSNASRRTTVRLYIGDVDTTIPQPQVWSSAPVQVDPGGIVDLRVVGAGSTQAEFLSEAYLTSTGMSPTQLSTVSWTAISASPAAHSGGSSSVVDTINHQTGVYEPAHSLVSVRIPETTSAGVYTIQVLCAVGSRYISNTVSVRVSATAPAAQDGFRLQATTLSGTVIASNIPYVQLAFTDELSDVGAGRVTLDFSSPFFTTSPAPTISPTYLAENEFIWQVWEGNVLRFSFLNSIAHDSVVTTKLSHIQEISGMGIGSILDWSVVAPPRFPTVPPYYWTFANARLWQWLTIWAECIRRTSNSSAQRRFVPTFTRYTDTAGTSWKDPGYENQQKNGVKMLDLLREHCDSVGADFHITPDFKIDVIYSRSTVDAAGKYFGTDRPQVIFRNNMVTENQVLRDRSEVANWVIAQDDYGEVSLKFSQASIDKNGMRESFVEAGRSGLLTTRLSKAEEELKWHQDQIVSRNLSVAHYYVDSYGAVFNRAFVDYQVGDWVYVEEPSPSNTLSSVQISAITVSVDSDGATEVEVTLESLASLRRRKAEAADSITSGGGSGSGGASLVLFEEEIFQIQAADPGVDYEIKYLPLPKSEIITLGMRKYMEIDESGGLGVREFTRTLRRGVHWERTGWGVKILDPTIFDEAF